MSRECRDDKDSDGGDNGRDGDDGGNDGGDDAVALIRYVQLMTEGSPVTFKLGLKEKMSFNSSDENNTRYSVSFLFLLYS